MINLDKEVISQDQAQAEVTEWLDKKKVFAKEREAKKAEIEAMVDAIVNGVLSIDETGIIKHTLIFPVQDKDGRDVLNSVSYKLRLDTGSINQRLKGLGMNMELMSGYGAALTDQPIGYINKMDTQDSKILRAIAGFFM